MKNNKIVKYGIILILFSISLMCGCSKKKSPLAPIPYVTITAPKTVFEGEGLKFYITYGQPVLESNVLLHTTGTTIFQHSNPAGDQPIMVDTVVITWDSITLPFYAQNNYDEIWVSFKDNDISSNKVGISLVNHSPILDSVKLDNMLLSKNADGDTNNIIRLSMNPSVKVTFQVFMHDADKHDSLSFFIEGLDRSINNDPGLAYEKEWVFAAGRIDTVYKGSLRLSDHKGGNTVFPLEIVIYSEHHSVWVASTHSPDNESILNKLAKNGKKVFSMSGFRQIKFMNVSFVDRQNGTEALWLVDWTQKISGPNVTKAYSDSVFVVDDDGKFLRRIGGFKGQINCLSLNQSNNIAYVVDTEGIKKLTMDPSLAPKLIFSSGEIEAMDVHQFNEDEFWAAVKYKAIGKRYIYHVRSGTIVDTLKKGLIAYDSMDIVKSLAVSTRNGIYWVGCDSIVLLASMIADTVIARFSGFSGAYVVADQLNSSPYAWIADAGSSKVVRIDATPNANLPGAHTLSASMCLTASGTAGVVRQPRSMSLDYRIDYSNVQKTLWIADYGNGRVLAINGTTGSALNLQTDVFDVELEAPEAISVNTGAF